VTGPDVRLLAPGATVEVAGRPRRIERRAGTDARPIVRLEGVAGRDAALALRGSALLTARDALPALGEDEYWADDLEGCAVVDGPRAVGVVRRMLALPSCEVLEVQRGDGARDLLVPLVRDAVRSVDVGARRIDVDLAFLGEDGGG
jgi:16S rRNA processing protein RimM